MKHKLILDQLGAKVRWTSLSQISLHKTRFTFLKICSQIPDQGEDSSGIHLPKDFLQKDQGSGCAANQMSPAELMRARGSQAKLN